MWSDVVCPWCYLGEHRLQRALSSVEWGGEVEVRLRAFQLDPRAPFEPQDLRAVIDRKYGPGAHEVMNRRLTALGAAEGLDYRFDLVQRVNSFDALRLLAWAGADPSVRDRQLVLARRLFRTYFTEGRNIAEHEVLLEAVRDAGLDVGEAARVLDGLDHAEAIEADREAAYERGITGVPAFVIEGAWLIPGAQEVDTMVTVLERARSHLAA